MWFVPSLATEGSILLLPAADLQKRGFRLSAIRSSVATQKSFYKLLNSSQTAMSAGLESVTGGRAFKVAICDQFGATSYLEAG